GHEPAQASPLLLQAVDPGELADPLQRLPQVARGGVLGELAPQQRAQARALHPVAAVGEVPEELVAAVRAERVLAAGRDARRLPEEADANAGRGPYARRDVTHGTMLGHRGARGAAGDGARR